MIPNASPKRNPDVRKFPVKLQHSQGGSSHILYEDTFLTQDLLPALEEARSTLGPTKAAYLLQESVRWMRGNGKLQTSEELTYIISVLTALQQDRELPKWVPPQDAALQAAREDKPFQDALNVITQTPYPGDDDPEDVFLSPTPSPLIPDSGATFVPTGNGDDALAHGSLHVEFSCTRSQVDDVISEMKWEVEAAADRLKEDYPNVRVMVSTSTHTVQ